MYQMLQALFVALLRTKAEIRDGMDCDYVYRDDIWIYRKNPEDLEFTMGFDDLHGDHIHMQVQMEYWDECTEFSRVMCAGPMLTALEINEFVRIINSM